jgi:hypothetical protein
MVEWLGLVVAVAAAYLAWRANHKSDEASKFATEANDIARRALGISESDYEDRRREREARARLVVSASVVGHEPDEHGVIRLGGSGGYIQLAITIRNEGDRSGGRGNVEVTLPLSMSGASVRWTDAGGHELSAFSQRAGRVGDVNVITRALEGIARDVPERLWLRVPFAVPDRDGANEYPIRARVAAEGAEGESVLDFPLSIGRDPNI